MADEFYAHTPATPGGKWHLLKDHLQEVARMAGEFGAAFGADDVCRTLGAAHDLGKADARFQTYLRTCARGERGQSTPHAAPGAAAVIEALGPFALAVMGHHGGLPDKSAAQGRLAGVDAKSVATAKAHAAGIGRPTIPDWVVGPASLELFIRMCFSALTDADYLDTEAHMNPALASERGEARPIRWYADALDKHLEGLRESVPDTKVNRVRAAILDACLGAAQCPPGGYRLTVPTGGGKTLSGLAFALRHARVHDLRRVVVAIPYTSIIDQTAAVYGGIFGAEQVLEHHYAYEPGEDDEGQSPGELRRKLAAENWDSPLVVTTTVQLFDSLFSNRPRPCRKLHRLARSVIVLDEAQTLPTELLAPILDALDELVTHYGCSIVFCTATQPDYSGLKGTVIANAQEIVPEPGRHFESLQRVRYRREPTPLSVEQVAERIDAEKQVLCILNTRRDAVKVARASRPAADLFHLSTLMCPGHRGRVLEEVRKRLESGDPVRLVATQVVEAGVDLDFPAVFRALGPLDRIVQAAGRCNREGRMATDGQCMIFEMAGAGAPRGWYRTGIALAATMVREDVDQIDQPGPVAMYFRELFAKTSTDAKGIRALRDALAYTEVAERFQMIPGGSVTLLVRAFDPCVAEALLAVPEQARGARWYRRMGRCSVSVPAYEALRMESDGLVTTEKGGMKVYEGIYDALVGIGIGDEPDPADLIV